MAFDAKKHAYIFKNDNHEFTFNPGNPIVLVDGKTIQLELSPEYHNGVIYAPLDILADTFQFTIEVNNVTGEMILRQQNPSRQLVLFDFNISEITIEQAKQFSRVFIEDDLEAFKNLLTLHPWLKDKDPTSGIPLSARAISSPKILNYLLMQGADPNARVGKAKDSSLLEYATRLVIARDNNDFTILQMLIQAGADVNDRTNGETILFKIIESDINYDSLPNFGHNKNEELVLFLLNNNADVNITSQLPYDPTNPLCSIPGLGLPLVMATVNENHHLIKILLEHGAHPLDPKVISLIDETKRIRRKDTCISKQRSLLIGLLLYAADNNSLPTKENIWNEIINYVGNSLVCPERPELINGYGYNSYLSGKIYSRISNEDRSKILAFADCSRNDHIISTFKDIDQHRHMNGKGYIAIFLDGQAFYFPAGTAPGNIVNDAW